MLMVLSLLPLWSSTHALAQDKPANPSLLDDSLEDLMSIKIDTVYGASGFTQFPASYRPFVPHEKAARTLRIVEHSLVTGLFQTEAYARAVLAKRPRVTEDEVEGLVRLRLSRQEILTQEDPPMPALLLARSARRQAGSTGNMLIAVVRPRPPWCGGAAQISRNSFSSI